MLFSFVRISYNQKSRDLLRLIPFIKANLETVALITLVWLTQVISRYATFSFLYVFLPSLVVVVFLEVALWSFNKLRDHMTYKNDIYEYKKRVIINYVTHGNSIILFANVFQPSLVIVSSWRMWYNVLNLPVITWLKVISPNGCMSFHPSHRIWFTCLFWNFDIIIKNIGNTKSGSLKNEIENSYYEVITKCDRRLLQSALDITKRDGYYKVRRNREAEIESCSSAKIELRYPETGSASKFNRKF